MTELNNEEFMSPINPEEPTFKTTLSPEQVAAALTSVHDRSFSGRHPELGKMIKCHVHGRRHRQFEFGMKPCEQKFTNRIGDYEYFREDENGELVPDYRTATPYGHKPTMRQQIGQPARPNQFVGPRYNPHYSKIKLQFIERVRVVHASPEFNEKYDKLDAIFQANLARVEDKELHDKIENIYNAGFSRLHRARIEAARQLRKKRRTESRRVRLMQRYSRRINRGLA